MGTIHSRLFAPVITMGAFISLCGKRHKEEIKMSEIIECVVDTKNKKEREELINYVSQKELFVSVIDDYDGFALVGIRKDGHIGYLGVICAKDLTENHNWKHFLSVKEFINYHEGK